jgi:hypothetical protein
VESSAFLLSLLREVVEVVEADTPAERAEVAVRVSPQQAPQAPPERGLPEALAEVAVTTAHALAGMAVTVATSARQGLLGGQPPVA